MLILKHGKRRNFNISAGTVLFYENENGYRLLFCCVGRRIAACDVIAARTDIGIGGGSVSGNGMLMCKKIMGGCVE
jgi:hypothetical protein